MPQSITFCVFWQYLYFGQSRDPYVRTAGDFRVRMDKGDSGDCITACAGGRN